MMNKLRCGGLLLLGLAAPVWAEGEALMTLLRALHENGTIDTATYERVQQAAQADAQAAGAQGADISRNESEHIAERVVEERMAAMSKPEVKGKPDVRLGGRLQMDAATYSEDQVRHNDGTEIRRARLSAEGELSPNWGYKLEYDFTATGMEGIQDAYLDFKGLPSVWLRLGHFREPFGLENSTSTNFVTFTERSAGYLFSVGRNPGIQAGSDGTNWSMAAGLFADGRDGAGGDNDEGWGFSGRGTYAPWLENRRLIHLGGALSYRQTGSDDLFRLRERPESHMTDTRIVDTGNIDADDYTRMVLESAFIFGPFSLQGEYYHAMISRHLAGNPDLDFAGFYLEASWFLTGESRNYNVSAGKFDRISPRKAVGQGGWGAWQAALRFSSIDLTDADIGGGEADLMTVGLNWYATPQIRFMANYVEVLSVDDGPHPGDEPAAFQLRAQYDF